MKVVLNKFEKLYPSLYKPSIYSGMFIEFNLSYEEVLDKLRNAAKQNDDIAFNDIVLPIVIDEALHAARALYLKNGFVDIPRYNDNYRADVFMERRLT